MGLKRLGLAISLLAGLLFSGSRPRLVRAQTVTPPPAVRSLLERMSPEERVGQLFLVTFNGTDVGEQSQIYDLIVNHHVGGVVLLAANDNFTAAPDTVRAAQQLIRSLQQIEWESAARTGQAYVPLWIGMNQSGDGAPGDQILNGLTPLPSEMAIGATWSPELAQQVGEVMGRELAALGVNLYFGPSLDVVATPRPGAGGDLGTSVFGGDPYWVGKMGSAYIDGLHKGSGNRLFVVAKHFPGRGASDRPIEEEIPTVRKSLEELRQIELAPFFAVTGNVPAGTTLADGLLVSHIRYQGFQGNIRATTRPISFDAQALSLVLKLPPLAVWREGGGLLISDDLGTRAVRQFYSLGASFQPPMVARDAFLAGNDLLYLGNITAGDAPGAYTTVLRILSFFAQKYRDDPAFAQHVDAAARRILSRKYLLYGQFAIGNVLAPESGVEQLAQSQNVTFEVARRAATLLSPEPQDLLTLMPTPPQIREQLVFLTDVLPVRQCSACAVQPALAVNAFQNAVVRLYGPPGDNQTSTFRTASFSLDDLSNYLAGNPPPYLADALNRAAWVILSIRDGSRGQPQLISRFLAEQGLLRNKRVILFSFGAPYYLDATDISRLTAYYALYSKQAAFVDVAARLLFQELPPAGASPISIPSLGYDLIQVTSPDPHQVIPLALDLPPGAPPSDASTTPQPTPVPLFKIGDTISIRTGVIRDHNGHPVPDGTVVRFFMTLTGEGGGIVQQSETMTLEGMARVSFGLDKPGLLQIRASSEPALNSEVLELDVSSSGQPAAVTVIAPPLTPPSSAPPIPGPQTREGGFVTPEGAPRLSAWLVTLLVLAGGAGLAFGFGYHTGGAERGMRWGLLALIGGLTVYNYIAWGLPGGARFASSTGIGGILSASFLGLMLGWGAAWRWTRRR